MARLKCPECGTLIESPDGWARAAVSTLAIAPAVAEMATQVRCRKCQTLFSQTGGGKPGEMRMLWPAAALLAVLLAIAVFAPG